MLPGLLEKFYKLVQSMNHEELAVATVNFLCDDPEIAKFHKECELTERGVLLIEMIAAVIKQGDEGLRPYYLKIFGKLARTPEKNAVVEAAKRLLSEVINPSTQLGFVPLPQGDNIKLLGTFTKQHFIMLLNYKVLNGDNKHQKYNYNLISALKEQKDIFNKLIEFH